MVQTLRPENLSHPVYRNMKHGSQILGSTIEN
jgi:hypothetical protein